MKSCTISTKDGLTFRVSDEAYLKYLGDFSRNGRIIVEGNSITEADKPQFRKNQPSKVSYLELQDTFQVVPPYQARYNLLLLGKHAAYSAEHGATRRIHYSLLAAVHDFVKKTMDVAHHYDAELVFSLADANYDYLQKHNVAPQKKNLDSRYVIHSSVQDSYQLGTNYSVYDYVAAPQISVH